MKTLLKFEFLIPVLYVAFALPTIFNSGFVQASESPSSTNFAQSHIPPGMDKEFGISLEEYTRLLAQSSEYQLVWDQGCKLAPVNLSKMTEATIYKQLQTLGYHYGQEAEFRIFVKDRIIDVSCTRSEKTIYDYRGQ